jgi:hypothetical protein
MDYDDKFVTIMEATERVDSVPEVIECEGVGFPVRAVSDFFLLYCAEYSLSLPVSVTAVCSVPRDVLRSPPVIVSELAIPPSIVTLVDGVFLDMKGLVGVRFSDESNLRVIHGFSENGFESIEIPASVEEIGNDAFYQCTDLKILTFAAGSRLRFLGGFVRSGILSVEIPDTVENLSAFNESSCLAHVTFGESSVLSELTGLSKTAVRRIRIPGSVVILGGLQSCAKLRKVRFSDNSCLREIAGLKWKLASHSPGEALRLLPARDGHHLVDFGALSVSLIRRLYIPDSVETISGLNQCLNLVQIVIGDESHLRSITGMCQCPISEFLIPRRVSYISGLIGCANLRTIGWASDSVPTAVDGFGYCGLTEITIPASVRELGVRAFVDCASLSEVRFAAEGNLEHVTGFSRCPALANVEFGAPMRMKWISGFDHCGIVDLVIPRSVEEIRPGAFNFCEILTTVTFEADGRLRRIGEWPRQMALIECPRLSSVKFSPTGPLMRIYGFSGVGLSSITIPDHVDGITGFNDCPNLTDVQFGPGSHLQTINGFCRCRSLASIAIPDTVFEINGFNEMPALRSVHFGESSQLKGIIGFTGTAIDVLDLPDSVEMISWGDNRRRKLPPAIGAGPGFHPRAIPYGRRLFMVARKGFVSTQRRRFHLIQSTVRDYQPI